MYRIALIGFALLFTACDEELEYSDNNPGIEELEYSNDNEGMEEELEYSNDNIDLEEDLEYPDLDTEFEEDKATPSAMKTPIPAKGKLKCKSTASATIYSNNSGQDEICRVDVRNTCGDRAKLRTHSAVSSMPETVGTNSSQMSMNVKNGESLWMRCCGGPTDGLCSYDLIACEIAPEPDAK